MKLFLVTSHGNDGISVVVIKCETIEELVEICDKSNYIWGGYEYVELLLDNFSVGENYYFKNERTDN